MRFCKSIFVGTGVAALLLLGPSENVATARPGDTASIGLKLLECHSQTDGAGLTRLTENDEIAIFVFGKRSDNADIAMRWPAGEAESGGITHREENKTPEQDNARCRWNKNIGQFDLQPGQSASLIICIVEIDGGTTKPFQQFAGTVLTLIPDPLAMASGLVINAASQFFHYDDSDDLVGAASVIVRNEGGQITSRWQGLDNAQECNPGWDGHGDWCRFWFDGAGTYGAVFTAN